MLPELCVELLEKIASELTQTDHANFRAVCKELNWAMERLFFSCLVVKTGELGELKNESRVQMLKALASGETGWPVLARALRITSGGSKDTVGAGQPDGVDGEVQIQNLFASALKSMKNIRAVTWEIREEDPGWLWKRDTVCSFLNALPALDELRLDTNLCSKRARAVNLAQLPPSGIRKFVYKGPRMSGFWYPPKDTPMYMNQIISRLMTQNRLTSLHLDGPPGWSALWRTLNNVPCGARLQLTEITTSIVTPELIAYLASYSGIRKLTLICPDGAKGARHANPANADRLADTFFETVVPRHAASLVELSCPSKYESRFSFGPHNCDVISRLKKLVVLEISINARQIATPQPVEAEQSDTISIVSLLLQTVRTLPTLRSLAILSETNPDSEETWEPGPRARRVDHIRHSWHKYATIREADEAFRSDSPSSAVVHVGYHTYVPKPMPAEEPVADDDSDSGPQALFGYFRTGPKKMPRLARADAALFAELSRIRELISRGRDAQDGGTNERSEVQGFIDETFSGAPGSEGWGYFGGAPHIAYR